MNISNPVKGKILIADDDDDNRILLSFLIQSEGWEVIEAQDGQEALEKAIKEQPNILLLDNRMPKLTGTKVYETLCEQGMKIPVILLTAYADVQELADSLGICSYLNKPYDISRLMAMIDKCYEESL
ncbi:two-component system response regulator [[Phormidium ambiguum] IAM M-71]|uniref:Two-component system response regulator n=1 Tax=[Phormidium ambiguum] IAM M-71 TaxID=454136 RepID=A0A1U7I900_9CYAN|nr:response regulator [Phormidium ambiguum]OKH32915.1 two-component system response regulator [Phormidium ambiguum IAM M-71]